MVLMVMVIALMVMVIALMVMVIALMGNGNSANANTKSYLMVVSAKYWWCSLSSSVVFD